jgi:two-component system, NtrC family, sensor kinase
MKNLLEMPAILKTTNKFMSSVHEKRHLSARIQPQKNLNIAKSIPSSLFLSLIILLFLCNWLWGATNVDDFYGIKLVIAILGVATTMLLAVSERWNAAAGNDRKSSAPDEGDRFFTISPDILCIVGFDGYFKHLNPAAEKILGYSPAEMLGQPFIEFVHPDDRKATLKEAESIAAGNPTISFENRWQCADGSYKWLVWNSRAFEDEELMYGIGRDITDRKIAEAALVESKILFESIIESTTDLIFVKDTRGRYVFLNSMTAAFFCKSKAEALDKDDIDFFPPEIVSKLVEVDRRIIQSGIEETVEELVEDIHGNLQTYLATKSPWRDKEGNIIGVVGVTRDISDIKQAETALRLSEQRLQLALWGSDSGIWDWNLVTDYIYYSPEYSALLGYEPTELEPSAIGLGKIVHPDDIPVLTEKLNAYFSDPDSSYAVEYRMLTKSGEFKWIFARGKVVERNANHAPLRIIGTICDISDRKQAEIALQQSEEKYRCLIEATSQIIWNTKADGAVVNEQPGWSAFTGKTYDEIKDWGWLNDIHPEDVEYTTRLWSEAITNRTIYKIEHRLRRYDGEYRYMSVRAVPILNADGSIREWVGVHADITPARRAEAELRQQKEFLSSIYDSVDYSIFVIDVGADGEFRYAGWNRAAELLSGICNELGCGKTPEELLSESTAAFFRDKLRECLLENSSIFYEQAVSFGTREVWSITTLTPLRDEFGKICRIVSSAVDITERKKAEAALQESQIFIEQIANASPNILYLYDEVEQRNIYTNREITATMGYTIEEVQNMGSNLLATIIHPDDLAKLPDYLQKLEAAPDDGEVVEFEYRMRDKNGYWHWLISREIVFSRTDSGKIKQRLGTATDVTDRKKAEQALAQQLKLSIFTADVGIALTQNHTLPATLQNCTHAIVCHLDAAFARIWTLNEEGNVLELQASSGMYTHINRAHSRVAVGEFKIGLIAKDRQPHLTNDVQEDPRVSDKEWAKREGMVAFAGYPLIVDNQLLGVIGMFARYELNESTLIALASVADAIALGIKRKQTEVALARQQQTLRSIIDNAPIWVWMANASGRMLLVNKTFCQDVAISEETFLAASHYSEVLGLEASANCMASDVQVWSQDIPYHAEEVLQLADGEYHHLETIKTQVKDDWGNAIGLIGLGLDVTEQKESQRRLQDSEARFRKLAEQEALLNHLANNIRASLDLDTILATTVRQIRELLQLDRCLFIWYQPEASRPVWNVTYEAKNADLPSLLGLYPTDATGPHAERIANLEIIRIDDFDTGTNPVERNFFMSLGLSSMLNIPLQTQSGQIGLICCATCGTSRQWSDDEVELLVAVGNQLTIAINQAELYTQSLDSARIAQQKTKQLELALCELQQAQTQLVQAEKMSSLGQMVAGIAHEINNPVSFIFGNLTYTEEYIGSLMKLLQMYRDEFPEAPLAIQSEIDALDLNFLLDDLPKMLSSMKVGATRIRDIVRSLRNFSRLDESEMKSVNLHEGIDSTLMILEHRLKAQSVSVGGTEYHRPIIQVVKEYGELPLVECYAGLLNQVFMNMIANAIDALEEQKSNPGIIRIRTEVEGDFTAIAISDNGAGITDVVKQRIFDPFYTTKAIGSGTGMGLAISHSIIVEKHKGNIKCISAVGKGTEFVIKIPIVSH